MYLFNKILNQFCLLLLWPGTYYIITRPKKAKINELSHLLLIIKRFIVAIRNYWFRLKSFYFKKFKYILDLNIKDSQHSNFNSK